MNIDKKKLLIITAFLFVLAGFYIYYSTFYVIVSFTDLGPLSKNMSAYYNSFKIGKVVHVGPDKDFKRTLVKVNLNRREINLPQNTIVSVERFPSGELYMQFIYPTSPSFQKIKRGDVLEGRTHTSIEQFMMGQMVSGMSDVVSIHIIKALNAADAANQQMQVFFKVTSNLIDENGKGIKTSVNNFAAMTKSLSQMAENLNETSRKLNNAMEQQLLNETALNIRDTTLFTKETTEAIAKATSGIDETIKKIDDTISHASAVAQNLNSMTGGLNETMSKRFGGVRLMFGKPLNKKETVKNACK